MPGLDCDLEYMTGTFSFSGFGWAKREDIRLKNKLKQFELLSKKETKLADNCSDRF